MRTPVTRLWSADATRPRMSVRSRKVTLGSAARGRGCSFQQRAPSRHADQPGLRLADHLAVEVPAQAGAEITYGYAAADQFAGETGEELLEDLLAPGQQGMDVMALRHGVPGLDHVGEDITVDYRHLLAGVRQHPGRERPRDAATKDHSMSVMSDTSIPYVFVD